MKFIEQKLNGVFIIEAEPFIDDRGAFRRNFCEEEFAKHGISTDIKQANISENKHAFTLRGFHYQIAPFQEAKTITCLHGRIYDIIVDLRADSQTFMQWISVELSQENRSSLHLAAGCANAFLTLEDNTTVHYYNSDIYHPEYERGIRYNDSSFGFIWPVETKFISEKDKNHPDFNF